MTRGLIAIAVALLALLGLAVWYEWRYPCVRWESATCTTCEVELCTYDPALQLTTCHCASWETKSCQQCAERAP